ATSEREKEAILQYFPGSDVLLADDLPNTKQPVFTTKHKQPGTLSCIFIARIHPIKNLLLLLDILKDVKANVSLTIIGPVEDAAYWQKCNAAMAVMPPNIVVTYGGSLPNHALLPLLQDQQLFILPTQGENFGHAIFESLLAGRPVLISNQTPWLGLEQQHAGWDLPLQKPQAFVAAIEKAAAWDQAIFDEWCRGAYQYAKAFIDNPDLKKDYHRLFS
ncbi:MAG TPA: glycosyltransferase, partial [Chitinophagaceae bacterium]|nr:glycosyltransferase [Chitinophagaceae bacterium]